MWPWEHLAFGYVCYALGRRGWDGNGPSHREAFAVAFGTQFPDLVDKPLAWEFGLLPSGVSLAHSLLFAVPVVVAIVLVGHSRGVTPIGAAFGVGYLSHIAGDLLYPLLVDGGVSLGYVLWPLVPTSVGQEPVAVVVPRLWASFVEFLATPQGQLYLAAELLFLTFALGLWLWDGSPGVPRIRKRKA